ncbi:unnamed protein product [Lathyrus oleraceus]
MNENTNSFVGKRVSSSTSNTSLVTVSNGLTSASHEEVPVTVGNNGMDHCGSTPVAPRTMGLTMAETLVRGSPRSHAPAQISDGAQKLEEIALKKSRLLVPMMPYMPRSMGASSLVKLKVKTSPQWHPISHSGNSHDFNALRELNGGSLATKHNLRFNGSRTLATTSNATSTSSSSKSVSTPSASITLEKKPTFQTQSRSDFLKNLSRKSASKDASRVLEKSKASTENEISCNTPESRDSTNEEQQYRANFILSSEEEEIAFLRSLGWEEDNKDNKDDECLTEKEIQDFYDKYGKLQLQ